MIRSVAWEWTNEVAYGIAFPIATDQIKRSRKVESDGGSGPLVDKMIGRARVYFLSRKVTAPPLS